MSNWFDLTLSREAMEKAGVNEGFVETWLTTNCTKWAYGRETGDSGYEHLQVRLVTSLQEGQVIAVWNKFGHVSRTHAKDFDYVLKDGNCVCSWRLPLEKYRNATLKDWQQEALGLFSLQDDRQILVCVDPKGGAGKSFLARYMEANSYAKVIPKMDRAGDMISAAMVCPSGGYIFDIPMADDKRVAGLWMAVEQIKNGHLYDWRYQYREMWIESPKIMVFSNYMPPLEMLARDRWQVINLSSA